MIYYVVITDSPTIKGPKKAYGPYLTLTKAEVQKSKLKTKKLIEILEVTKTHI